jgi:hypothetical protein
MRTLGEGLPQLMVQRTLADCDQPVALLAGQPHVLRAARRHVDRHLLHGHVVEPRVFD